MCGHFPIRRAEWGGGNPGCGRIVWQPRQGRLVCSPGCGRILWQPRQGRLDCSHGRKPVESRIPTPTLVSSPVRGAWSLAPLTGLEKKTTHRCVLHAHHGLAPVATDQRCLRHALRGHHRPGADALLPR